MNLPDGSALDLVRGLRPRDPLPVLLLTANDLEVDIVNDLEVDIVNGLEAGADDYVTKPFSLAVLRARVAALTLQDTLWFFTYRFSLLPLAVTLPCFAALGALLPPAFYRAAARHSLVERLRQAE